MKPSVRTTFRDLNETEPFTTCSGKTDLASGKLLCPVFLYQYRGLSAGIAAAFLLRPVILLNIAGPKLRIDLRDLLLSIDVILIHLLQAEGIRIAESLGYTQCIRDDLLPLFSCRILDQIS